MTDHLNLTKEEIYQQFKITKKELDIQTIGSTITLEEVSVTIIKEKSKPKPARNSEHSS